jgi:hypothetical protein
MAEPDWCKFPYIKSFQIENNGIDHTTVRVNPQGSEIAIYEEETFLYHFNVDQIWESKDDSPENSLVVKLSSNKYLFINDDIFEFELPPEESIVVFMSPFGGSGVPNPWIVTTAKKTYVLQNKVIIPTEPGDYVQCKEDPYHRLFHNETLILSKFSVTYVRKGQMWDYYKENNK